MGWKTKKQIQEEQAIPQSGIPDLNEMGIPPAPMPSRTPKNVPRANLQARPPLPPRRVVQDLWVLEETPTQVVQTIKNTETGEEISVQEALVRILNFLEDN